MKIPISEHIKSAVIGTWISGKTRDKIASEYNIGSGSVSNIIDQWKNRIGVFDANSLRESGLALKKAGITPIQCIDGLRIINIINQLGIDEDHLFDFLQKLYNESKKQKLEPIDIARLVKVINAFPIKNSLNNIPQYINKKQHEKIKLDKDIDYRKHEIEKLDKEIENKRKEIQDLKEDFESVTKEMQNEKKNFLLLKNVKKELEKNDIDIHVSEPLIYVIKIFQDMHFELLTIFSEFSDIKEYRNLVDNKDRKIKGLESHIKDLKTISDNYETKIASNETIVLYIKQLENIGINTFDIKTLEWVFSEISKKNGLTKKEIKFRFFRYLERLHILLTLEQDIFKKTNKLSIIDSEIYSRRKIIGESQPIVFSILQNLLNAGLNENDILMAFNIFKTDLCNNMPLSNRTYLEQLSKDLEKYKTVRNTLKDLSTKILLEKSHIGKLAVVKSNLEAFLFSIGITTIYFYSILLNTQIQIQKNLMNLLICYIRYFPLFCVIIRDHNKSAKSKSKIEENNNNKKKAKKEN
jgi:uncharacterized coiled-coil DUF342 family protein